LSRFELNNKYIIQTKDISIITVRYYTPVRGCEKTRPCPQEDWLGHQACNLSLVYLSFI